MKKSITRPIVRTYCDANGYGRRAAARLFVEQSDLPNTPAGNGVGSGALLAYFLCHTDHA